MNATSDSPLLDTLLTWGANTLLLATVQGTIVLTIAAALRRQPVTRHATLLTGLLLLLLSPMLAAVLPATNLGRLRLPARTTLSPQPLTPQAASTVPLQDRPAPVFSTSFIRAADSRSRPSLPQAHHATDGSVAEPSAVTGVNTPSRTASAALLGTNEPAAPLAPWGDLSLLRGVLLGLLAGWGAGAILLLVRLTSSCVRLATLLREGHRNPDATLTAAFSALDGPHIAELVISEQVAGPVAAGWSKPRVVWPADLLGRLTPDETRNILAHELAHIRRGDQVIVLFQNLAAAGLWIHPLTHLLNRELSRAREEVCDNAVLTTIDPISYSRTLLSLAQSIPLASPQPATVGFLTTPWRLESRIAGLLDGRRDRASHLTRRGRAIVSGAGLAAALLSPLATLVPAAEPDPTSPASPNTKAPSAPPPAPSQPASPTPPSPAEAPAATPPSTGLKPTGFKPSPNGNAPAPDPDDDRAPLDPKRQTVTWQGRVVDQDGRPVAATVAVVGFRNDIRRSVPTRFAEVAADAAGHFRMEVPDVSPITHRDLRLVARAQGFALAWRALDPRITNTTWELTLGPAVPVSVRFVDSEGRPAAKVHVTLTQIVSRTEEESPSRRGGLWPMQTIPPIPEFVKPFVTDADGRITIPRIPADHGVMLMTRGTEAFATQYVSINTGMPEERPEHDQTYRGSVKNVAPGETATVVLAPARPIGGVVLLGDTDQPAARATVLLYSGEQRSGSKLATKVETDDQGRFRTIPHAGVEFSITVEAPEGTPYFARFVRSLDGGPGERGQNVTIRLKKGRLVRGTVTDARTGKPLRGATVLFYPRVDQGTSSNEEMVVWNSNFATDAEGRFQIVLGSRPGTLMVDAPYGSSYVLRERSQRELTHGEPGGTRIHAHAFVPIEPAADPIPQGEVDAPPREPLSIPLEPTEIIEVRLVDPEGRPIEQSIHTSRLHHSPGAPEWRGIAEEPQSGPVEIRGLAPGERVPVWFLDPKRQLGAVAVVSLEDPRPTVVLRPCAAAKVQYRNPDGTPVRKGVSLGLDMVVTPGVPRHTHGPELEADEDFIDNFDRETPRQEVTDAEGRMLFSSLVPGGTYRIRTFTPEGKPKVGREFVAEAGKVHDLGDVQFDTVP